MREVWQQDPSAIVDGERGDVAPVPGAPGTWWVRGTETVYLVDTGKPGELTRGTCECKGCEYRGTCAHIDAVVEFCSEMRRDARLSEWVQEHWFGQVLWQQPRVGRTAEEEARLRSVFA